MSETNHTLGKFCSVAKKGTIILPKKIPGYKEPEGQTLMEPNQKIKFKYTPIVYGITYDLAGGSIDLKDLKKTYTIEDPDYKPEAPTKDGFMFNGWEPSNIPTGSIGNKKFTATWIAEPVLFNGDKLNKTLIQLANGADNIGSIALDYIKKPDSEYVNVSCTNTKILARFENGNIYLYCDYDIHCNHDMNNVFNGFTMLRNIDDLINFICPENTSIVGMFKNCSILANVEAVEYWANGKFSNITDAFTGTIAVTSGRVPSWYKWIGDYVYKSTTGKILDEVVEDRIPGAVIYSKTIPGYKSVNNTVTLDKPNIEHIFEYNPIQYNIEYVLNGGQIVNPKTKYTIEDETYYPPDPIKPGFKFTGWDRKCITSGEIGNVVFVAQYTLIK